jgi:RNA polymerase sigma-70 factor (ECF subfamily)
MSPEPVQPASASDDVQLMISIASGNAAAFERLYARLAVPLVNLVRSIVRCPRAAEDIRQEVFREIWHRAGEYRASLGSPFSWIMTIARNRAIDRLRSDLRQLRHTADYEAEFDRAESLRDLGADSCAMAAEASAAVRGAVERLQPPEREAVELAYFEGLSTGEIAQRLHAPLATVRGRVRRALRHLEHWLAPFRQ